MVTMNELEKLTHWKGTRDYNCGYHRGKSIHERGFTINSSGDKEYYAMPNNRIFIKTQTDSTRYSESHIQGFNDGMKEARLKKLLLK